MGRAKLTRALSRTERNLPHDVPPTERERMSASLTSATLPDLPSRAGISGGREAILTPRQRDCVLLAAMGNCDEGIAIALGISKQTAHKHIEGAKRRFGVTSRLRLVVCALFTHEISFASIFGEDRAGRPAER
jgi:DNA-binding CsgD family transcriptional regulator